MKVMKVRMTGRGAAAYCKASNSDVSNPAHPCLQSFCTRRIERRKCATCENVFSPVIHFVRNPVVTPIMASLELIVSGAIPRKRMASGMLICVPSFSVSALPASMID